MQCKALLVILCLEEEAATLVLKCGWKRVQTTGNSLKRLPFFKLHLKHKGNTEVQKT